MFWGKKKSRAKAEVEDDDDIESGRPNAARMAYNEREVMGALDMAKVALNSVRRRAEQSEGEVALLSVQLQDESLKWERERQRRLRAEKDLGERNHKVASLERAVADGILAQRRAEQDLRNVKQELEAERTARGAKEERIAALVREKDALAGELAGARRQLAEARETAAREAARAAEAPPPASQAGSSDEDVSAAAMTLARALAREMSGFGRDGLETEASATASAALRLAEALGSEAVPPAQVAAPVTPPLRGHQADGKESASAGPGTKGVVSGSKAYLTAPAAGGPMRKPLSSAKSHNASPWPASVGGTIGQFLSWTSATKAKPKPSRSDVETPQHQVEYSLTSW